MMCAPEMSRFSKFYGMGTSNAAGNDIEELRECARKEVGGRLGWVVNLIHARAEISVPFNVFEPAPADVIPHGPLYSAVHSAKGI